MSKYTITLYEIIAHYSQSQGNPFTPPESGESKYRFILNKNTLSLEDRIQLAADPILGKVGEPGSLAFFDEEMRDSFWKNFCIQNAEREIEYETTTYFLAMLRSELALYLPRYNKLWESTKLEIDKLKSYSRDSMRKGGDASTGHKEGSYSDTGKTVNNDTPTNKLGDADYANDIVDTNTSGNNQSDGTTKRDYWEQIKDEGYTTPQADLILKYRETLIDVIRALIDDVSQKIFLKIYS